MLRTRISSRVLHAYYNSALVYRIPIPVFDSVTNVFDFPDQIHRRKGPRLIETSLT